MKNIQIGIKMPPELTQKLELGFGNWFYSKFIPVNWQSKFESNATSNRSNFEGWIPGQQISSKSWQKSFNSQPISQSI